MTRARENRQKRLQLDPAQMGYPKNRHGEFGLWQDGACFAPWQAEWHKLDSRYSSIHAQFGIVELEDCSWLSDIFVWAERFATRRDALTHAVTELITAVRAKAQPRFAGRMYYAPHMSISEANAVIAWANQFLLEPAALVEITETSKPPIWSDLPLFAGLRS